MVSVQVIDLGINNLLSLVGALQDISCEVTVVRHGGEVVAGGVVVLPGTGSFGEAMTRLQAKKFPEILSERNQQADAILGICLGMQLFGATSEESPGVKGLSLLSGHTRGLGSLRGRSLRVPHVGWSPLTRRESDSFAELSVADGTDFYFSHSYHFVPSASDTMELLTTEFGDDRFVAGVRRNHVVGLQFHPEKSGPHGLRLLADLVGVRGG